MTIAKAHLVHDMEHSFWGTGLNQKPLQTLQKTVEDQAKNGVLARRVRDKNA